MCIILPVFAYPEEAKAKDWKLPSCPTETFTTLQPLNLSIEDFYVVRKYVQWTLMLLNCGWVGRVPASQWLAEQVRIDLAAIAGKNKKPESTKK